jgi:hypothetical protein
MAPNSKELGAFFIAPVVTPAGLRRVRRSLGLHREAGRRRSNHRLSAEPTGNAHRRLQLAIAH